MSALLSPLLGIGTRRPLACALIAGHLALGAAATPASALQADCDVSSEHPNRAPVDAGDPVARTPCPGVRPGGHVWVEVDGQRQNCTLNFLVAHADEHGQVTRYIGTAGHCVLNGDGRRVWDFDSGAQGYATDASGQEYPIGHVVYARLDAQHDFALVKLDDGVEASPQMCHWGGPTAIHTGNGARIDRPRTLRHYGHGIALGQMIPARTGWATDLEHPETVFMTGAVTWGDSGGPVVLEDGAALGVAVAIGGTRLNQVNRPGDVGNVKVQRLAHELAAAEADLGLSLALDTAPVMASSG